MSEAGPPVSDQRASPIASYDVDLRATPEAAGPIARAGIALENVAFHDFAFHDFLLPPEEGYSRPHDLTQRALAYLDELENQGASAEQLDDLAQFLTLLEDSLRSALRNALHPHVAGLAFEYLLTSLYDDYLWLLERVFTLYLEERELGRGEAFVGTLYRLFRMRLAWADRNQDPRHPQWWRWWFDGYLVPHVLSGRWHSHPGNVAPTLEEQWQRFRDLASSPDFPFTTFPPMSVNVGLRLVYRQEWRPLGVQPGEIVRTVPLGPGQKERVSVKVVRRRKRASTSETTLASETSTETTDSTKDSTEIVREWAETTNWNTDHKISGGFFDFIRGEHSLSYTNDESEQSRNTASRLSEAMRATSTKVRRETKVVVSTESEESFERETASEISNPNNEMAITYEYLKLQQQYEVFTYLAEVESVIFVAEQLPSPADISEDWIRRHDSVVIKVLKDESYRSTLNELIQDTEDRDPLEGSTDPFREMLDEARRSFAQFHPNTAAAGGGGLTIPDIYSEPQRIYRDRLRATEARERANRLREVKRERLKQHIRDHILYYCRAIWSHEDRDQRLLRYRREGRRVPVEWSSVPPLVQPQPGGASPGRGDTLVPTGRDAPLWDVIDPTGPLGYVGNYAVFGLRPPAARSSAAAPAPALEPPRFEVHVPAPPSASARLSFTLDLHAVLALMRATYVGPDGTLLDPALADAIDRARPPQNPSDATVADIVSLLPRLRDVLLDQNGRVRRIDAQGQASTDPNDPLAQPLTRQDWGEYLYRRNGTRRFLVDTNNLYLNIHTGPGAALEPFKRAHRYLDVLQAAEQLTGEQLKNQRRQRLLGSEHVYDPDVRKVVIVGASRDRSRSTARSAALSEALEAHLDDGADVSVSGGGRAVLTGPSESEPTG